MSRREVKPLLVSEGIYVVDDTVWNIKSDAMDYDVTYIFLILVGL